MDPVHKIFLQDPFIIRLPSTRSSSIFSDSSLSHMAALVSITAFLIRSPTQHLANSADHEASNYAVLHRSLVPPYIHLSIPFCESQICKPPLSVIHDTKFRITRRITVLFILNAKKDPGLSARNDSLNLIGSYCTECVTCGDIRAPISNVLQPPLSLLRAKLQSGCDKYTCTGICHFKTRSCGWVSCWNR